MDDPRTAGCGGMMEPENDCRRGHTTNEVPFQAGELEAFVQGGRECSSKKMVAALMRSGVPESEAKQIAASILESPQPYGF
jgi:hypothetical protein